MYGALALIWIIAPAFVTTMGSVMTDIVYGTCVPWGAFSSYVAEKTLSSMVTLFTYLLPMVLIIFCYFRIVYRVLTRKVGLTTGAALHDNNEACAKVTTQYGRR